MGGTDCFEEEIAAFCEKMYQHALKLAETDTVMEQIQKVGKNQLLSWKLLVEHDGVTTHQWVSVLNGDTAEFPCCHQCGIQGDCPGYFHHPQGIYRRVI